MENAHGRTGNCRSLTKDHLPHSPTDEGKPLPVLDPLLTRMETKRNDETYKKPQRRLIPPTGRSGDLLKKHRRSRRPATVGRINQIINNQLSIKKSRLF